MDSLSQQVSLIVIVSFFLLLVAGGVITLVMVYRRKQVEYIHEQNRLKVVFEKALLEAQLEVQEQTMKHIAQEVHDNVNQTLGLAKLNLNTLKPDGGNGATEKISATKELVSKAITDLRNLSKTLHADAMLSNGIAGAIETELSLIARTALFETAFTLTGDPVSLSPQQELILFRTVQEALQNAIKHSGATQLEVTLSFTQTKLQLTVADNGKGFDFAVVTADPKRGIGLRNMQNRIDLIGGQLQIQALSAGTKICITLPIIVA